MALASSENCGYKLSRIGLRVVVSIAPADVHR
jgi:hypothetical protein